MISDNHTRELKYLEKQEISAFKLASNFQSSFHFFFPFSFFEWAAEEGCLGCSHPYTVGKESEAPALPWQV